MLTCTSIHQDAPDLWAAAQFQDTRLGHCARRKRLVAYAQALAEQPGTMIPELFTRKYDIDATYELLDQPQVTPDAIQRGHRRLVRQELQTPGRYLLIEDPLPAGAETIADDSLYPLEKRRYRPWGARQEFRDDRAVFFQDGLPGGRMEFWYLLKVATPGTFRAMPAQVTPMYVPDVSASTTDQTVTFAAPTGGQP